MFHTKSSISASIISIGISFQHKRFEHMIDTSFAAYISDYHVVLQALQYTNTIIVPIIMVCVVCY